MLAYYINLTLILGLAFPLCIIKPAKWKSILYLCVTFGYMWFLASFRHNVGFDYQIYIDIFESHRGAPLLAEIASNGFEGIEPGFIALNKLMALFVHSPAAMYGIYSFLIFAPVAWFIYRHCKDIWQAAWLYVTLAFFYSSMNFIRQGLACSVIVLGYGFLKNKKTVPFILVVLLAACFHKTALIMVPVYFLCHLRFTWKRGAVYGGITLLLYITSPFIVDFVTDYIFTGYKGTIWLESGLSVLFLFVPAVLLTACLALKTRWGRHEPDANMLLNLTMFSFFCWVFITNHFILERFGMYMYIFAIAAVPSALLSLKASPEVYEKYAQAKASKKPPKEIALYKQDILEHNKYYWSAVAALIIITLCYNEFGMHTGGFHGVFPYSSIFNL
ncbi:MAG: EpsG family protein [Oscillospiraceae bacterium]|nr:EpsG family protein [Oscillospiraceae bacterium]